MPERYSICALSPDWDPEVEDQRKRRPRSKGRHVLITWPRGVYGDGPVEIYWLVAEKDADYEKGELGREQAGLSASDRFQTGFRPVSHVGFAESMSQCLLPHTRSMSPCHVRSAECHVGSAECHVGCTSLERNS